MLHSHQNTKKPPTTYPKLPNCPKKYLFARQAFPSDVSVQVRPKQQENTFKMAVTEVSIIGEVIFFEGICKYSYFVLKVQSKPRMKTQGPKHNAFFLLP